MKTYPYVHADQTLDCAQWVASSGLIELNLTPEDASSGSHSGSCDEDIAALRTVPYIAYQLARIPADRLRAELLEYGAWDDDDLSDHDANLDRILWLACGDLCDESVDD